MASGYGAAAITGWFVFGWNEPVYYSYGSGGSVYYEGDTVYVQGEPYGTAEQYYTDAYNLTDAVPEMTEEAASEVEWMPLGVFRHHARGCEAPAACTCSLR